MPSPIDIPTGCKFAGRCPYATADKKDGVPKLEDVGGGHFLACFQARELIGAMDGGNF